MAGNRNRCNISSLKIFQLRTLLQKTFFRNVNRMMKNVIINMMNNKQSQTAKYHQKVAFGNTIKMPLSSRKTIRSTSASSRKPSRISSKKTIIHHEQHPFCKTFKKSQLPEKNLKSRFDQLVNQLFLKIDFDCSGFITYTKVGICKDIPERVFYFFGGVFQKVKQLGGVASKMFLKLCEQAFIQAKREDIEAIINMNSYETNKRLRKDLYQEKPQKVSLNFKNLQYDDFQETEKQNFLSTKKINKSGLQKQTISLKIKTQADENKSNIVNSARKLRLLTENDGEVSYRDTSNTDETCKSFQSDKVRILNEILNRQIEQSKNRLRMNQHIK